MTATRGKTNPRRRDEPVLVDTSAAAALLVSDHAQHESTFEAIAPLRLGLAGHAAFETFSVLTRLPAPARRTPAAVLKLLSTNFPETRFLSEEGASSLLASLPDHGIAGGSVYDALVGATAVEHGLTLATRDERALTTYAKLGVAVLMIR